jgi:CheY-like chemotaxis protein
MTEPMDEHTGLAAPLSPMTRAQRRSRLRGRRVLYVDDELNMRRAVARLLHSTGAIYVGTDTHAQAVVLVALEPLLDLAILDFQMPDGDVGHLVRRLRIQRPGLSLVGTSATDRRADFAARGVGHFLLKPWTLEDLLGVTAWPDAPVRRDEGPAASTASALDLPGSGDTRGHPAQGRL